MTDIFNQIADLTRPKHMTKIKLRFGAETYLASESEHKDLQNIDWNVTKEVQTKTIHAKVERYDLKSNTVFLRLL